MTDTAPTDLRSILRTGLSRSLASLLIKVATAGLTYGMIVQLLVIPFWGPLGAAIVNMTSRIVAQLGIAWWSRRHIGLDTSLLGAFMVNRQVDAPPAR